ncbi:MAG TPA: hypothetical protein VK571_07165 [Gemmatimonadaceae bacterium]|nr:hypothetical protein [Gemmatimonadaceae bacterium]
MTDELPDHLPAVPFARPLARDAYFAPPSSSSPDRHYKAAVLYQGEYETLWDGTAVAVRAHARALHEAKIPVFLKSFTGQVTDEHGAIQPRHAAGLPPQVEREVSHLELTRARAYIPTIKHLVIRDAEHLKRAVIPHGVVGGDIEEQAKLRQTIYGSTIVYSVWERDRVDPAIVKTLNRVAQCWVPSSANARMLINSGVHEGKVFVVPHPYDPEDLILKLRRRKTDTAWRKFYSIGRWEPRKGYAELVRAFLYAFTPQDNAILTIKYTGGQWPGYPTPEQVVVDCYEDPAIAAKGWTFARIKERVKLIEGRFPRQAILELHYRNNIYVSSSHGEAWNLPAFEAALAGNTVCYVPSGGVEDYLKEGHVAVAAEGDEPVPKSYGWESDARWVWYPIAALESALQRSWPPESHAGEEKIYSDRFTMEAVGQLMRRRVLEVAGGRGVSVEAYVPVEE